MKKNLTDRGVRPLKPAADGKPYEIMDTVVWTSPDLVEGHLLLPSICREGRYLMAAAEPGDSAGAMSVSHPNVEVI